MATGSYLDTGEPVVLIGDSGTGKTHLLIGLGIAACEQGRRVRYATCAQLVNELVEAADQRRLARLVTRYGRLDLLCVDELGYVQLDSRGAELLFQVLTEREEKASVAVASNLGALTAAKIVGETAGIARFKSSAAFARHNGTAPLPVWSSNHTRHRLSRAGNRQLNAALHRIALTQIHWHPPAKELFGRRKAGGDGGMEALRVLKRRLSDVVYRALIADATTSIPLAA